MLNVSRFLAVLLAFAGFATAFGAEPVKPAPEPQDKVNPAKYRILVEYDDATLDRICDQINDEVRRALDERLLRLRLARSQMESDLREELRRYKSELEAVDKARREERRALDRGDRAEAEKWKQIAVERLRNVLELSGRARQIEEALLATSLQDWRDAKNSEAALAEKMLQSLEAALAEIQAKEQAERSSRGPVPPAP